MESPSFESITNPFGVNAAFKAGARLSLLGIDKSPFIGIDVAAKLGVAYERFSIKS